MHKQINITKADGEREIFDITKLESSLKRAGANDGTVMEISQTIEDELVEGMHTMEIYKRAFSLLKKKEKTAATRYSVRRAIMDMGPNGFPFEDFVGEIFRAKGYHVEVGKTVRGFCVLHELDITAENDKEFIGAEIKFHNSSGITSDIKTALYVKARFDDLEKGDFYKKIDKKKKKIKMLITNTKFSSRAVDYGVCVGLTMISWNYPEKGNLQDLIEENNLHPLTCLTSLNKQEKLKFLNQGIVLCREIRGGGENILGTVGVRGNRVNQVLEEARNLCRPGSFSSN
ncbi:hypothetical protein A2442_04100 [Candidatus Campbellbacteria bacterium RIFOXYC2_FULL_35_25]|uniref:ATP-cone domain-containing protein n=1 Tax=Candidatus Campbellbacteria bacterium RIFOXYC2_FULL_35_25 TaxID=1797582 RepID=A0A1F5EK47_9BACT|nr:MAG: hypothetical protein A2442_04100 [Candidatus Campbellbacteria bacterium RIFOXYC2_FULL_35_25]